MRRSCTAQGDFRINLDGSVVMSLRAMRALGLVPPSAPAGPPEAAEAEAGPQQKRGCNQLLHGWVAVGDEEDEETPMQVDSDMVKAIFGKELLDLEADHLRSFLEDKLAKAYEQTTATTKAPEPLPTPVGPPQAHGAEHKTSAQKLVRATAGTTETTKEKQEPVYTQADVERMFQEIRREAREEAFLEGTHRAAQERGPPASKPTSSASTPTSGAAYPTKSPATAATSRSEAQAAADNSQEHGHRGFGATYTTDIPEVPFLRERLPEVPILMANIPNVEMPRIVPKMKAKPKAAPRTATLPRRTSILPAFTRLNRASLEVLAAQWGVNPHGRTVAQIQDELFILDARLVEEARRRGDR